MAGKGKALVGPVPLGPDGEPGHFLTLFFSPQAWDGQCRSGGPEAEAQLGTATVVRRRSLTDFELSPVPVAGSLGGAPVGHISSLIPIRDEQEDESEEEEEKGKGQTKRGRGGKRRETDKRATGGWREQCEEEEEEELLLRESSVQRRSGMLEEIEEGVCRDSGATTGQRI
ncbi:unnamed protein product [Calypogeia fissa]